MKEIVIFGSYCNTKDKLSALENSITQAKSLGLDVLVFGRYPMQGGGLSFLFLAFLPFLIWLSRPLSWRDSRVTALSIAALSGIIAWMVLRPSVIAPRYILVPLLLLTPILTIAVERVLTKNNLNQVLRIGTTTTVFLAITASFWHLLPIPGAIFSDRNLQQNTCLLASSECNSFYKLSKIAQPGDRIFVGSHYPYWLTPSQLQCRNTLDEFREANKHPKLLSWLKSRGFSYAIVDPSLTKKIASDLNLLSTSDTREVKEIQKGFSLKSYQIRNDTSTRVQCVETIPGRWHLQRDLL